MTTSATPLVMRGYIDKRLRPLLLMRGDIEFVAMVDTGFNAEMWCGDELAGDLNFRPSGVYRPVSTVGGSHVAELGEGSVEWFGIRRTIISLVKADEPKKARREPSALIGMALLRPDRLIVDLLDNSLIIVRG
jgi:predicted aspartyl protease